MQQKNLFNVETFDNYLKDIGVVKSRRPSLAVAINNLHNSLCQMDYRNLEAVHKAGLNNILVAFAKLTHSAVIDFNQGKHDGKAFPTTR